MSLPFVLWTFLSGALCLRAVTHSVHGMRISALCRSVFGAFRIIILLHNDRLLIAFLVRLIYHMLLPHYWKGKGKDVTCGQVWWPILGICAQHLTHPSVHTAVSSEQTHTHCEHTPGAVGSQCCGARGAVGGTVPCSRVSPQSWYWRWRRALVIHSPHLQFLPDLRLEPATFG